MSKNKVVEPVEAPVFETALPVPSSPVKRFTFDQWFTQCEIKEHHKNGLKAFCKNPEKLRTIEEWNKVFVGY